MAIYDYECPTHGIFEEEHSIKIKLEFCPQCKELGKDQEIKRLISLPGKGVVELSGQELVNKLKQDSKNIQKEASKSDKAYSNLIGESHYQSLQTRIDKNKNR